MAVLYLPIVRGGPRCPAGAKGRPAGGGELDGAAALAGLDSAEMRYEQLRGMIGADIVRDLATTSNSRSHRRSPESATSPGRRARPTRPREWPLFEPGT